MVEVNFARLQTHGSNIERYRQLLKTSLTDFERQFIARRLSEEQLAIETLATTTPSPMLEEQPRPGIDPRAG